MNKSERIKAARWEYTKAVQLWTKAYFDYKESEKNKSKNAWENCQVERNLNTCCNEKWKELKIVLIAEGEPMSKEEGIAHDKLQQIHRNAVDKLFR